MKLMGRDLDRIRREHLRGVRVVDFAELWVEAERRDDVLRVADQVDWALAGVLAACRWIANAAITYDEPVGGRHGELARTPLSGKAEWAIEELIEEETLLAERLVGRWEWPGRPGYVEGVFLTLAWIWRRSGVPPIEAGEAQAG
ncbi:hypothetical protein [Kribbella sp. NBC_00889]|uniref:hypothetical protein n=1 Tax=Kribbella sp. NBC_00889 TaxID=2975974 RepID=UPI00386A28B6|nr:hypothetical protein OG817_31515 [Kribbella sp. NBC_00889]